MQLSSNILDKHTLQNDGTHIILHYLNNTLDSILHSRQHGFKRGLSCETQLCSTYHDDIAKLKESSSVVHAAFDKVPHKRLVDKLKNFPNVNPRIVN